MDAASDAGALRDAYQSRPDDLLHSGFTFSWWRRGGEPGPDWASDTIELSAGAGRIMGRYIRARNQPAPPFRPRADEYTGSVPPSLVVPLLQALFQMRLFERKLPSEERADLADAVRQTFQLRIGSVNLEKTLHEPDLSELGELAGRCEDVAAHLRDTGRQRDISQP